MGVSVGRLAQQEGLPLLSLLCSLLANKRAIRAASDRAISVTSLEANEDRGKSTHARAAAASP